MAAVPQMATVIAAFSIAVEERTMAGLLGTRPKSSEFPDATKEMAVKLAVIWIHGLGDRGSSWRGLEDDAELPGVKAK